MLSVLDPPPNLFLRLYRVLKINFFWKILQKLNQIKKSQAGRIGIEELKFYDDLFTFRDGNAVPQGTPDELLAAAKKMYTGPVKTGAD